MSKHKRSTVATAAMNYIKYGEILSFACRVNVMKLTGG